MRRHGVSAFCDHLTFCRDVGWRKPARAIFHHVLRLFDCGPEDCFFVGDSVKNDIVGARQAGIPAVLIDRGGHHEGVDAPRIRTLAELDAIIDR